MKLKSFATGLAALSLMAMPTMAAAAPTAAPQPAQEQVAGDNAFLGGSGALVGVLALLAIIGGIIAATSGSDKPNSP